MAHPPYSSQFDGFDTHARPECVACEASFTDALDQTLSPAEQKLFEHHLSSCVQCAELFAEAQRGHAWLELLKTPRPEPRPELLAGILAQTSGNTLGQTLPISPALAGSLALPVIASGPLEGRLLAFRPYPTAFDRLGRLLLEPRLAMTAAMAFFSITLTMSLTGVRLNDLHASDLNPSNLRRSAHGVQAGAVRYYDNLRVVHVLESRVDTLREDLQQRRQQETPVPADREPGSPETTEPANRNSTPDGGSSSTSPQGVQPTPLLNTMATLLRPWPSIGDRA